MTHGTENGLLYAKNTKYKLKSLWSPFTADNCPSLAGKPKMFFIQACRGRGRINSIEVDKQSTKAKPIHDSVPEGSWKLPIYADFLWSFCTIAGNDEIYITNCSYLVNLTKYRISFVCFL